MESEISMEDKSVVQERLDWQVAWRDAAYVAQAFYAGEMIEEMHHLSDAGLLDECLVFLTNLGMLSRLSRGAGRE